jgi:hypothetical protein
MRTVVPYIVAYLAASCLAQEATLIDARRELGEARDELKKVVTMCRHCRGAGRVEQTACAACEGRGAMLKSEALLLAHREQLKGMAERKGAAREDYNQFDVADRLTKYDDKLEPEGLELLPAYVRYVKIQRKYKDVLGADERLLKQTQETVKNLDRLIDRHGERLVVRSMALLYEDDSAGKVGAFKLYGRKGKARIGGEDVELLQMRTLKEHTIILARGESTRRKGLVLAEIVGKGEYETEDGRKVMGILLQAY